jgi:uncharacterized protein (TIGR03083 family)
MDRDELFQRIDTTWQELQAALDGIPPERATEPGVAGEWSVKNLLGHITFWERNLVTEVQNLGPDEVVEALDTDEINAREHERYKNRPLDELQAEFQESHKSLMQALQAVEDLDPKQVAGDTWDHYPEHAAQIRDWRERVGV